MKPLLIGRRLCNGHNCTRPIATTFGALPISVNECRGIGSSTLSVQHHYFANHNHNAPSLPSCYHHQSAIHTTSNCLIDNRTENESKKLAANDDKSSSADGSGGGTGFGSFLNRRNQEQLELTLSHNKDLWNNNANNTTNITTEYDFGINDNSNSNNELSDLQLWHSTKETEFHTLSSAVSDVININNSSNNNTDVQSILSLMTQLNNFLSSITSEMHAQSEFRQSNTQYPPSSFMTDMTYDGASHVESLLSHLLGLGRSSVSVSGGLSPSDEVAAYKLAISAWSHTYHPQSGDKSEIILESYGQKYGGDMNYMPNMECYKTVLMAHLKSCSSFFGRRQQQQHATTNNGDDNDNTMHLMDKESPGEKSLGILKLLTSVYTAGDIFLKPDIELYSYTISAVRNTLLDWQNRRRYQSESNDSRVLESNMARGALDALEQMENTFHAVIMNDSEKDMGKNMSLHEWHCMIRAYADALAIAGKIPIDDAHSITGTILTKLESFIVTNSTKIVQSVNEIKDNVVEDDDAQLLLESMQKHVEDSYTSALNSGLKNGSFPDFHSALNNAMLAEEIFLRMRNNSQSDLSSSPELGYLYPSPTPENYQALVKCWCECVRKKYSNNESNHIMTTMEVLPHLKAVSFLKQLEIQMAAQPIDGSIYGDVIWAWGQVLNWPSIYRDNDEYFFAANAADKILKKVMQQYENGSVFFYHNEDVTKMYNHIFRLHSNVFKGGESAVRRSLNLLDQMEHWYKQSEGSIAKPSDVTFAQILKTISNSGVESSAANAAHVIGKMEKFGIEPNERHYLGLIRAHARVGQRVVSDPTKAEAVLQHVKEKYVANKNVKPTTAIYTACIAAYGGSRQYNSTSKVMELFEELLQLSMKTNDKAFRPDSQLYGTVINAIAKAQTKDNASIRKAIHLLDKMEKSYEIGEIESGPNRYAYTNLLRAISQSDLPDSLPIAEELMRRMDYRSKQFNDESIRPDVHAYTALIQALAKSGHPGAVSRAEKWFKQMEQHYEAGDEGSKPNKVTCTALINCWRSSGYSNAGEEAENILSMMEERSEDGDLDFKPDNFVYSSVIDTWARSKSKHKSVQAWNIYQRMKVQYKEGNMEAKPNNIIVSRWCELEIFVTYLICVFVSFVLILFVQNLRLLQLSRHVVLQREDGKISKGL